MTATTWHCHTCGDSGRADTTDAAKDAALEHNVNAGHDQPAAFDLRLTRPRQERNT